MGHEWEGERKHTHTLSRALSHPFFASSSHTRPFLSLSLHKLQATEYYRNMLPDVPIVLCHSCNHFFHEEDWEFAIMTKGCCPFCRLKTKGDDTGSLLTYPPQKGGGGKENGGANVLSIN